VSPGYRKVLEDTVDWLISLRFRDSSNYPAQLDDPDDTLVHWCHGAVLAFFRSRSQDGLAHRDTTRTHRRARHGNALLSRL
jgi:hypothetical protein